MMVENLVAGKRARRGIISAAGVGALAALFGRPSAASAADGDPLILGTIANVADSTTEVADAGTSYHVAFSGGSSLGPSDADPNYARYAALAAWTENGGTSVLGENDSGYGVRGLGGTAGVFADGGFGTGLIATGHAHFQLSGKAIVQGTSASPKSSVTVSLPKGAGGQLTLAAESLIFATGQRKVAGVWVQSAVPASGGATFVVTLSKAVTSPFPVAWFIVN